MNLPATQTELWDDFIDEIKCSIPRQSFLTWFGPMRLTAINNGELTVQVPSQFYYDWIEEHYSEYINSALDKTFGDGFKLSYSILERGTREVLKLGPAKSPYVAGQKPPKDSHLNSRYTFDNFIEGDSNSFAKAGALAVAEAPGKTRFNPMVIFGGVGLGKTHLIQAIGNFAVQNKTSRRAIYASSEKFTFDFITSVRENKTTDFSNLYRSTDILLVDDVQFLEGKERTQMEFFHTFNTLYNAGKQVVLTMDCPPSELKRTEARLISRYQCGLVVDIQPPDYETRVAILQKRADEDSLFLGEDVIETIAANITSNVRELEGALIRLMAHASITGQDIDIFITKRLLRDVLKSKFSKVSVERIQEAVSEWVDIPSDLLRGNSRKKEIARARQISMYLCDELTNLTLKSIGSHFGNRDHSTVIHAVTVAKKTLADNDNLRREVMEIRRKLETSF
ncbi:MAG: chromosomal replication initiator protein DnaA [candidate division Zixibacteria bacterium]|nr:chromosomal replication initiator protein DnaA [Candidatus Tariuqbacter arcticus]